MSTTSAFDYIIVGQGLAGSYLSMYLLDRSKRVLVVDPYNPSSSSNVAAGLLHPITGRRIVKTWLADKAIAFADKFYADLEKRFGQQFFFPQDVLEILTTAKQWNDWTERKSDPSMAGYIGDENPDSIYRESLVEFLHALPVKHSGWMDIPAFLDVYRNFLKEKESLLEETFDSSLLKKNEAGYSYKGIQTSRVVFCEGFRSMQNPLWSWLPFQPAKGEILTIEAEGLPEDFILIKSMFIVPLGKNQFRAGATYSWDPLDEETTETAKEHIINLLKETIKVPFRIIGHKAAVRPTVQDRRPFLGEHPELKGLYIFNGLGTKGILLGPYFSEEMCRHLMDSQPLNTEVDIRRFNHTYIPGLKK